MVGLESVLLCCFGGAMVLNKVYKQLEGCNTQWQGDVIHLKFFGISTVRCVEFVGFFFDVFCAFRINFFILDRYLA